MYTDCVNFNVAELLNNKLFGEYSYAAEDCEVTWDNYLGVKNYHKGEFIEDGDYIHGKSYSAPTYAEVFDWLFEHGFVVELMPAYTFALNDRVAYYWVIYRKNDEQGKLELLLSQLNEMSSFELAIEDIIKKVLEFLG